MALTSQCPETNYLSTVLPNRRIRNLLRPNLQISFSRMLFISYLTDRKTFYSDDDLFMDDTNMTMSVTEEKKHLENCIFRSLMDELYEKFYRFFEYRSLIGSSCDKRNIHYYSVYDIIRDLYTVFDDSDLLRLVNSIGSLFLAQNRTWSESYTYTSETADFHGNNCIRPENRNRLRKNKNLKIIKDCLCSLTNTYKLMQNMLSEANMSKAIGTIIIGNQNMSFAKNTVCL